MSSVVIPAWADPIVVRDQAAWVRVRDEMGDRWALLFVTSNGLQRMVQVREPDATCCRWAAINEGAVCGALAGGAE